MDKYIQTVAVAVIGLDRCWCVVFACAEAQRLSSAVGIISAAVSVYVCDERER